MTGEMSEELAKTLREVQQSFSPYRKEGESIVDELIAERRWEAALEDAESDGDKARIAVLRRMPEKKLP